MEEEINVEDITVTEEKEYSKIQTMKIEMENEVLKSRLSELKIISESLNKVFSQEDLEDFELSDKDKVLITLLASDDETLTFMKMGLLNYIERENYNEGQYNSNIAKYIQDKILPKVVIGYEEVNDESFPLRDIKLESVLEFLESMDSLVNIVSLIDAELTFRQFDVRRSYGTPGSIVDNVNELIKKVIAEENS